MKLNTSIKRLKSFQEYQKNKEKYNIGDFIIWKILSLYIIYEIIEIYDSWVTVKEQYRFDSTNSTVITQNNIVNKMEDNIRNFSLYNSDNLQDCIDMIPILIHSTKYNI
jgi:hypothetical protein